MKSKKIIQGLLLCLVAWGVLQAYDRQPITYGSIIRLKHSATGKFLTADNLMFDQPGSSGHPAIYCGKNADAKEAQWTVKGFHNGDRWNFAHSDKQEMNSAIGFPLRVNSMFRLENVGTGRNLHGNVTKSPCTGQREITNYGERGVGNSDDNFIVEELVKESFAYVSHGFAVKIRHANTGWRVHSHSGHDWKPEKQEATLFGGHDNNDWFVVEIVAQPDKNEAIAKEFKMRGAGLSYWTPVYINPESTYWVGSKRLWTHGGSRHDPACNNQPPHDHMELVSGPWQDGRTQTGPSCFVIVNADDSKKIGPVNFGENVKIISVWGGAGEIRKAGLLQPFRYWWMGQDSRWGKPHREIIISRPEHPNVQSKDSEFVFDPIIDGQTGQVTTGDILRIRSVSQGAVLWLNGGSRWGNQYYEILADKDTEDQWGLKNFGYFRRTIFEKFNITLATSANTPNADGQKNLAEINQAIGKILADNAAQQKEIAKKEEDRLAVIAAKAAADKAEAKKREDDRLAQYESKKTQAIKKKLLDNIAKVDADIAALGENGDPVKLASLKTLRATLETVQADVDTAVHAEHEAAHQLQDAVKIQAEKKEARVDAAASNKVDVAVLAEKHEKQNIAMLAEDMKNKTALPLGFLRIPGQLDEVVLGLHNRITTKTDAQGKMSKVMAFDDFCLGLMKDGSVVQYLPGMDTMNPWQRVEIDDEKGKDVTVSTAAVGMDGTTYAVSMDGKSLYAVTWGIVGYGVKVGAANSSSQSKQVASKKSLQHSEDDSSDASDASVKSAQKKAATKSKVAHASSHGSEKYSLAGKKGIKTSAAASKSVHGVGAESHAKQSKKMKAVVHKGHSDAASNDDASPSIGKKGMKSSATASKSVHRGGAALHAKQSKQMQNMAHKGNSDEEVDDDASPSIGKKSKTSSMAVKKKAAKTGKGKVDHDDNDKPGRAPRTGREKIALAQKHNAKILKEKALAEKAKATQGHVHEEAE